MSFEKNKQIIVYSAIGVLITAGLAFGAYAVLSEDNTAPVEQSQVPSIKNGGGGGTNVSIDDMPDTYKANIDSYNEQKRDWALGNPDVNASMSIYAPSAQEQEDLSGVEPDAGIVDAVPIPVEYQAQTQSVSPTGGSSVDEKKYPIEKYYVVDDYYAGLLAEFDKPLPKSGKADEIYTVERANSLSFEGADQPRAGMSYIEEEIKYQAAMTELEAVMGERAAARSSSNGQNSQTPESVAEQRKRDLDLVAQQRFPVKPGDIFYGYFINEGVSKLNTPVLVKVSSGPLKGAVLNGKIENVGGKALVSFDSGVTDFGTVSFKGGAVNPDSVSSLIDADYNPEYWNRFGMPLLADAIDSAGAILGERATITECNEPRLPVPRREGDPVTSETYCPGTEVPIYSIGQQIILGAVSGGGGRLSAAVGDVSNANPAFVRVRANEPVAIISFSPVSASEGFSVQDSSPTWRMQDSSNLRMVPIEGSQVNKMTVPYGTYRNGR